MGNIYSVYFLPKECDTPACGGFGVKDSAWRLVGALLAKPHEEWSTGRRYLTMGEFYNWLNQQSGPDTTNIESNPTNRTLQPA